MMNARYALSHRELYLYDTTGILHRPGVLTAAEVQDFRCFFLEGEPHLSNPTTHSDRWNDLAGLESRFHVLARDPRLIDPIRDVINQPLRLAESYALRSSQGSFLYMHNGNTQDLTYPDGIRASRNMAYRLEYHDGRFYTTFVKALIYLQDIPFVEAGPFCYIEGSHKANLTFPWPKDRNDNPVLIARSGFPTLRTVPVAAGDMILLNECLLHGAMPKQTEEKRIVMAFSYTPAFMTDWHPIQRAKDDISSAGYYDLDDESDFFPE